MISVYNQELWKVVWECDYDCLSSIIRFCPSLSRSRETINCLTQDTDDDMMLDQDQQLDCFHLSSSVAAFITLHLYTVSLARLESSGNWKMIPLIILFTKRTNENIKKNISFSILWPQWSNQSASYNQSDHRAFNPSHPHLYILFAKDASHTIRFV